jgi:hypothetical protein
LNFSYTFDIELLNFGGYGHGNCHCSARFNAMVNIPHTSKDLVESKLYHVYVDIFIHEQRIEKGSLLIWL